MPWSEPTASPVSRAAPTCRRRSSRTPGACWAAATRCPEPAAPKCCVRARMPRPGRCGLEREPVKERGTAAGTDAGGRPGKYSMEVPQQERMQRDTEGRPGTVTCGDGRGWTCCLLFASRGSGVRVPLAPQVRDIIRNHEPEYKGWYSS